MGSIYEGSYLAIAASTSSSDQQGFLENAESRYLYLSWDLFWEDSSLPSGIKVRSLHDAREGFHEEPLSTRAWTFQERLLPRRLLTYSTALMWECEVDWCECGSGLFPDPFLANPEAFYWPSRQKYRDLHTWNMEKGLSGPYEYWNKCVVESFMDRAITKESDCLPAISAIASKIQVLTGDQYLAGLWGKNLAHGLAWRRDIDDVEYRKKGSHSRPGMKTKAFRAPSWSWASCTGSVSFPENMQYHESSQITVLEAGCTLQGKNRFGEISGGFLRLSGRVLPMLLDLAVNKLRYGKDKRISRQLGDGADFGDSYGNLNNEMLPYLYPDTPLSGADGLDAFGNTYRTARRTDSSAEQQPDEMAVQVLCLLVSSRHPTRNFVVLGGLPSPPGAFERIGFLFAMEDRHPSWFGDMEKQEVLIF
jgi:hypothetical protein